LLVLHLDRGDFDVDWRGMHCGNKGEKENNDADQAAFLPSHWNLPFLFFNDYP
jgi:hypothetical protein